MKKLLSILLVLFFAIGLIYPLADTEVDVVGGIAMIVNDTRYSDLATGWSEAVKLAADNTKVTVKLFADWTADSTTGFVCPNGGTYNGALYVNSGDFTLDLNGYTIDRNTATEKGSVVLYLEDCTFTVTDTSAGGNGKITGGYYDYGGGIYANDCTLQLNGGNITENMSNKGGGIYAYYTDITMNGGTINSNTSTDTAGGILLHQSNFIMNDGVISENYAVSNGGAIFTTHDFGTSTITMNGGVIEENSSDDNGGVVYLAMNNSFTMNGGIIRNNTALNNGGVIYCYQGDDKHPSKTTVSIKNGIITGNVAKTGCGGAIYWNQYEALRLTDCTITGNSAPNNCGGAIYVNGESRGLCFSGTVNITGNTAFTNRSDNADNICIINEASSKIMQREPDSTDNLNTDSRIGLSFERVNLDNNTKLNDGLEDFTSPNAANLTKEMTECFFSDDPYYTIASERHSDDSYYDIYLSENPNVTADPVLTVKTGDGSVKDFNSFDRGWIYVLDQNESQDVTVVLHKDWVGCLGDFSIKTPEGDEVGTTNGALSIPSSCRHDLTIDLNGYSINRALVSKQSGGYVIYMNTGGSLTIIDSSADRTGTITGGNSDNGGGIYVDYGTLYLSGVTVTGNRAEYGAGIYCDDLDDAVVYIQDGAKIYGNTASVSGGGIYSYNGYLYVEDGEITNNHAETGAGIYWHSDNICYLTGGKITGNRASATAGGIYATGDGAVFLGGTVNITDNIKGNLYLGSKSANIFNACGQNGAPNKPLTNGAKIGISSSIIEEEISEDNSKFNEGDFRFMYSDSDSYFIRSAYDENNEDYAHKLYINSWSHADARYPRVKTAKMKNTPLLDGAEFDYNTQTLTLYANKTKRNFFEELALSNIIECTYDRDVYYLYQMNHERDLRSGHEYKIMSDNGTYVMFIVRVIPNGGTWSEYQEPVISYKMSVAHGSSLRTFNDMGEGWVYAVSQTNPVTVTLFSDWTAYSGGFDYSDGTDDGRLYLEDGKDITIDLNGYKINRNLTSATGNGQVFLIEDGSKLTITDTSETGGGKITGGYTDGDGGAFYIDYGKLYINGGEISGNRATGDGGAIYGTSEDDTFVYINGGKITGNTATENGGAIFMYNGYLYVDGGEISSNKAELGGGIYWDSKDKLCLTGGSIRYNSADKGGGVYASDWGTIYIGGTIRVSDNTRKGTTSKNNFYISDTDVYLNNAAGQSEVPNKPLTESAYVGISNDDTNVCISGSDSRFTLNSIKALYADSSSFIIQAKYNANDGNHAYKLYCSSNTSLLGVKSVEAKSAYVNSLYFDHDFQSIKFKFNLKHSVDGTLKSISLGELVNVTFEHNGTQIVGFNEKRDFTKVQEFMVLRSDGAYVVLTVRQTFACLQHEDADKNNLCDYCGESIVVYGDINQDTEVTVSDVIFMLQAIASDAALTDEQLLAGDVNGNNEMDVSDVIRILQYLANPDLPLVPQI